MPFAAPLEYFLATFGVARLKLSSDGFAHQLFDVSSGSCNQSYLPKLKQ